MLSFRWSASGVRALSSDVFVANALLIAETVSALPELLDAIDAMRAELEENEGVMKVLRRRASSSRAEALAEAVAACEDNVCANRILAIEGA